MRIFAWDTTSGCPAPAPKTAASDNNAAAQDTGSPAASGASCYIPEGAWFNHAAHAYSRGWDKAGIGFDDQIGKGTLFVRLDGTANGTMAGARLAALCQVAF